jgi:hypothetical protein
MQSFECVLQQPPAAAFQRAEHAACFAVAVAGLHTAEVGANGVAFPGFSANIERLQVADVV